MDRTKTLLGTRPAYGSPKSSRAQREAKRHWFEADPEQRITRETPGVAQAMEAVAPHLAYLELCLRARFGRDWQQYFGPAYLRALARVKKHDPEQGKSLRNFLVWRIQHEVLQEERRQQKRAKVFSALGPRGAETRVEVRSREAPPAKRILQAELKLLVQKTMLALPTFDQEILFELCMRGVPRGDLADQFNVTPGGVGFWLDAARKKFARAFKQITSLEIDAFIDARSKSGKRKVDGRFQGDTAAVADRLIAESANRAVEKGPNDWTVLHHGLEDSPASALWVEALAGNVATVIIRWTDGLGRVFECDIKPSQRTKIFDEINGILKLEGQSERRGQRVYVEPAAEEEINP